MRGELELFKALICLTGAKIIVEVGVAAGDSTIELCSAALRTKGRVFGFDIWDRHGIKKQFCTFGTKQTVDERLSNCGYRNYSLTQIDTVGDKASFTAHLDAQCPNGIDFAFIDGDHSYSGVKSDFSVIYPRLSPTGIIAFHDTLMIDGCREFILDLRTRFFDGTFDIIDLPFGGPKGKRVGISLLVKRSFAIVARPITEVCGSRSTPAEIELQEIEFVRQVARPENFTWVLDSQDEIKTDSLGEYPNRKKFE